VPYPNEHAARILHPNAFVPDSFASWALSGGVRIILGRLKGESNTTVQAYRFPVRVFTEEQAKEWLTEHDIEYIAFEPATGSEGASVEPESKAVSEWRVGASRDLPIHERREWNASNAKKRVFKWAGFDDGEPDGKKAKLAFLIYDAANPDIRASYKLPFADFRDGELFAVDAALRAAASRLPQTDITEAEKERGRSVLDTYFEKMENKTMTDSTKEAEVHYYPDYAGDLLVTFGTEVKALGDGKVGGYLVRFGSSDQPDLEGDFFDGETDFGNHTSTPVFYHHGLDETLGQRVIGKGELKTDEVGIWITAQLNLRDGWEKAIYDLVKRQKMGWSSGTAPHLVAREDAGGAKHIKTWLLGLDASITPNPAEPRQTGVVSLKSIVVSNSPLTIETEVEPEVERQGVPQVPKVDTISEANLVSQERTMSDEIKVADDTIIEQTPAEAPEPTAALSADDVSAIAAKAAQEAAGAAIEAFKAEKAPAPDAGTVHNVNAKKVTSLGFADDHVKAFEHYCRTGDGKAYMEASEYGTKALSEGTDSAGGYLVPTPVAENVAGIKADKSVVRLAGASVMETGLKVLSVPTDAGSTAAFAIVSEGGAVDSTDPVFGQTNISSYMFNRLVRISDELASDNEGRLMPFLEKWFGQAAAKAENQYFLGGSGSGQPAGAITDGTVTVTAASTTAVTAAEIVELYYDAKEYRENGVWVMDPATEGAVRALTGNPFSFAMSEHGGNIPENYVPTGGNTSTDVLMGKPAFTSVEVGDLAASRKAIVFGDWSYYYILDYPKNRFTIRRLNELYAGNSQIGLLASFRTGGALVQATALSVLQMAAS